MRPLDFDQLLDAGVLRASLSEATGRGVHVGILDTGVDVTHPDLQRTVVHSVEVVAGRPEILTVDGTDARHLDPVGHGTACAGIIHELAPEARLVSVRVIGAGAYGTGEQLMRGLQWTLDQHDPRIQVVNLSLGTLQDRFAEPLRKLVDRAYVEGAVLVAAANNMGLPSFPAQFASLVAVDSQTFPDPLHFEFRRGRPVELAACGSYVRAPKSGGGYQLWTGTSFACPHITAIIARLLSISPDLTPFQVKTLLYALRHRPPVLAETPSASQDGAQ